MLQIKYENNEVKPWKSKLENEREIVITISIVRI